MHGHTHPVSVDAVVDVGVAALGLVPGAAAQPPPEKGQPPEGPSTSCGDFQPFDSVNPPGEATIDPGDEITYTIFPGDGMLFARSTRISWGDRVSDVLSEDLRTPDEFTFSHIYYNSGRYNINLTVFGTYSGTNCSNHTNVGFVNIPQPTRPLAPAVAARKCDDFLKRRASGRIKRILRSATRQPRSSCRAKRAKNRTCTTTVIDRRRCKCRYRISTRVPASGKPKVLRISKKRL